MKYILGGIGLSLLSSISSVLLYKQLEEAPQQKIIKQIIYKKDADARLVHLPNTSPQNDPITNEVKDFVMASQKARPAVVHILSSSESEYERIFGGGATGSGVIISKDGYIVTNNHVIEGSSEVEITLNDRRKFKAKVIGTDPSTDLAVLKVDKEELAGEELPTLSFKNSDMVKVGHWVLAVGNPFNLTSTVTAGIVSAKGRNIDILEGNYSIESFIQTDAVVNPGNSGGALIDPQGNLVGINTAIITKSGRYEGYSFAIPANLVKKVMTDIIEFGKVQRGYLGVTIRNLTKEVAEENGLKSLDGIMVQTVNTESAASEAGLQKGDIITHINDVKVHTSPELQEQIALFRPGSTLSLQYIRGGENFLVDIVLKGKNTGKNTSMASKSYNEETLLLELGVEARGLNEEESNRLKTGGVLIEKIEKGSVIDFTNMDNNFIITSINKKKVETLEDMLSLINEAEGEIVLDGFYEAYQGEYSYIFELE